MNEPVLVRPAGPIPARIMIVGEVPGENEVKENQPFVGYAGKELTNMLHEAGIMRSECFLTNVIRYRPEHNKIENFIWNPEEHRKKDSPPSGFVQHEGMFVAPFVLKHLEMLKREIELVEPNVIVPLGNYALWALCGRTGITNWRSSKLPVTLKRRPDDTHYKAIACLHPSFILRAYEWRYPGVQDFRRVKDEALSPRFNEPDYQFCIRPTFKDVRDFLHLILDRLEHGPQRISFDIETRGMREIACFGVGISKTCAMCIPILCSERRAGYWTSVEEEVAIIEMLKKVARHPNARIIGQNYNYDQQYTSKLWGWCVDPLWHDTMVGFHTCFPGLPKRLDYICSLLCQHYTFWKEDGKEWAPKQDENLLWSYNCKDCVYTWEAAEELDKIIDRLSLRKQFEFQMQVNAAARRMMARGVLRDKDYTTVFSKELDEAMLERLSYFERVLGHPLNPGSNGPGGQMQQLFYMDLRLPVQMNRKTARPSLDGDALDVLAIKEPLVKPIIQAITEFRSLKVYKSNFVEAAIDGDGRIRTNFNSAGTETFRWSSSKDPFGMGGNLQNIPKGGSDKVALFVKRNGPTAVRKLAEELSKHPWEVLTQDQKDEQLANIVKEVDKAEDSGYVSTSLEKGETIVYYRLVMPNIRRLFLPDPGYVIMDWDLDRADLQVVVWEAADVELKQMLREGVDLHTENAKVIEASRQMAKTFIHACNYGAGARTLARHCGLSIARAEWMQNRWFAAHPGIKRWHIRTEESLKSTRSVTNKFGYRRFYFDRLDGLLPEALAWVPQSTVALVINTGLVNLEQNLPSVIPLLQVHDSIGLQTLKENYPTIVPCIKKQLSITIPYDDPLIIPCSGKVSETSWGDCKDIPKEYLVN